MFALNLAVATLERIKDNMSSSFRKRNIDSKDKALSKRDCLTYKLEYNNT